MSAPKSVVKIRSTQNQCTVEYVSNVDACQYYIYELSRGALRDVGKFIAKKFKENYYSTFKEHSKKAGKSIQYKVWSGKSTLFPRVEISFKGATGFYSSFQEFGTSGIVRKGLLQKTVEENVDEIRRIESQYLSAVDTGDADSMIDEADQEGDGDE